MCCGLGVVLRVVVQVLCYILCLCCYVMYCVYVVVLCIVFKCSGFIFDICVVLS